MGLLDDAIREHLDLKRRRGGDPTEIERAEREALGPVRRSPEPLDEDLLDHEAGEELPPHELEPDYAASEEEEPWEREHDDVATTGHAPFDHEEPTYEPESMHDEEPLGEEAPLDAPRPSADAPSHSAGDAEREAEPRLPPHPADDPPSARSDLDQETEEYELEPERGGEDDMLESTPEFLQDAPDHDRLWFEQRPPRDFDFDG
jgi:hypothetical protein